MCLIITLLFTDVYVGIRQKSQYYDVYIAQTVVLLSPDNHVTQFLLSRKTFLGSFQGTYFWKSCISIVIPTVNY